MNNMDSKGFTLVELLAVIVLLAVIMMIATTQVLPIINDTKKGAFASTANTIMSAVETAVITDETLGSSQFYCYDVNYLVEKALLKNVNVYDSNLSTGFSGYVEIDKTDKSKYIYTIYLTDHTNTYTVVKDVTADGLVDGDDVEDSTNVYSCKSAGYNTSNAQMGS